MQSYTSKNQLSEPRRRLLEMMQEMNFGRIEKLLLVNAEPCLDPRPRVVVDIKLGAENGPRPERVKDDFELKLELKKLFAYFDEWIAAVVEIEVKHGVPFRVSLMQ